MQAERKEGKAGGAVQAKAELLAQAAELRQSMGESQLHSFRTESNNRWGGLLTSAVLRGQLLAGCPLMPSCDPCT